ncbi:MAG: thiamine pyrophosphate-dependent enzyme [Thermoprotei archaeon]
MHVNLQLSALDSEVEGVAIALGDEAVARGAEEAGVDVATAYPGTPSSEVLETLARHAKKFGFHVEWSTNEMVAFEVAYAAALAGKRAMTIAKHLGTYWMVDPLMVAALTGVNAGFVIVTADDTHPYSSQNTGDTRYITRMARLPEVEPATVQEAKDATKWAFEVSEKLGLPVFVRLTHRLAHARAAITLSPVSSRRGPGSFKKNDDRYVMVAANVRKRQPSFEELQKQILSISESCPFNNEDGNNDAPLGVVACGGTYQFVREAISKLPNPENIAVFKLAMTNPLPQGKLVQFMAKRKLVLVVEEVEPIVEVELRSLAQSSGINALILGRGTGTIPRYGEITTDSIVKGVARAFEVGAAKAILSDPPTQVSVQKLADVENRYPYLCAGCPHAASYLAIKRIIRKHGGVVAGDRGCYNQGVNPPLRALDTCISMGASISMAVGFEKAGVKGAIIAVIGDSTFFHAGIPALIDAVMENAHITVAVLDNRWTAMTGHQPSPSTGLNAMGEVSPSILVEDVARAVGVKKVITVDPLEDIKRSEAALEEAISSPGPSVVVFRHECALQIEREARRKGVKLPLYEVDPSKCTGCRLCVLETGCPALVFDHTTKKVVINASECTGCGLCQQDCPFDAIHLTERK